MERSFGGAPADEAFAEPEAEIPGSAPRPARADADARAPIVVSASLDPFLGRVIHGRYKILERIAIGGMGIVYKARQLSLGRICALKILLGDGGPDVSRRFFLEAATVAKLRHPSTVTVFDFGRTPDGVHYIAMEYIPGRTLREVLRSEAPLDEARALHIARQIARSLREAHRVGIVHRDLKPSNVLLVEGTEEADAIKLVDFGLLKRIEPGAEEITQAGMLMGSPKYMSPEQLLGTRITVRTDVYAFGLLLCEMLAGKLPFERASVPLETMMAQARAKLPPFSSAFSHVRVSARTAAVVDRCLLPRPEDRFASIDEVIAALREGDEADTPEAPACYAESVLAAAAEGAREEPARKEAAREENACENAIRENAICENAIREDAAREASESDSGARPSSRRRRRMGSGLPGRVAAAVVRKSERARRSAPPGELLAGVDAALEAANSATPAAVTVSPRDDLAPHPSIDDDIATARITLPGGLPEEARRFAPPLRTAPLLAAASTSSDASARKARALVGALIAMLIPAAIALFALGSPAGELPPLAQTDVRAETGLARAVRAVAVQAESALAASHAPQAATSAPANTEPPREPDDELPAGPIIRFRDGMEHPHLVSGPDPEYTPEALARKIQGTALVRCVLLPNGRPTRCRMERSLPYLDDAILRAMQARRYTPIRADGRLATVEYVFGVTVKPPPDPLTRLRRERLAP